MPANMEGRWVRQSKNGRAIIFIHGLFSTSKSAWLGKGGWWPDLVTNEEALQDYGIYLFDYDTSINSVYYSLGDAAGALNEYFSLDGLMEMPQLFFVAHSMGGIIARKFLVTYQTNFINRQTRVGLFLIASPSLGSSYANLVHKLGLANHVQISSMQFDQGNAWLNDLDRDFRDLKESRHFPIVGRELVESNPVFLPRRWFGSKQIVFPTSAAVYFGKSLKIPGSDHLTIAKPASCTDLQHRMLVSFVIENSRLPEEPRSPEEPALPVAEKVDKPQPGAEKGGLDRLVGIAIAADRNGLSGLPPEGASASEVYVVAARLVGGRMFERMMASWLVKRHGDPVAVFRAALATGNEPAVRRAATWLRFASKPPAGGYSALAKEAVDRLGIGQPDSVRLTANIAGYGGENLTVPGIDFDNEWAIQKYAYDCHKALIASASTSRHPGEIGYAIRRAIEIARQAAAANIPLNFFDHLGAFRLVPAANAPAILKELVEEEAPDWMTEAFLARLCQVPNRKTLEQLSALIRSERRELAAAARMALAFLPAQSNAVRETKAALLRDVDDAFAAAAGVDFDKAALGAVEELLTGGGPVGNRYAAAWGLGRIARVEESARPLVARVATEDNDELVRAILLAEMATYDPTGAAPGVHDALPNSLGLERFLLAIAETYTSDAAELMTTLASTSEDQIYVPYLLPFLQRQFVEALAVAAKSSPLLAELWALGDST